MSPKSISIRLPDEAKRLLESVCFVTGHFQVDVLVQGLNMYVESLSDDVRAKVEQAMTIRGETEE
ncbi:hypothetical protein NZD89_28700 (plasmid) [Alicyclobacillus fastidiosus]|uniref:CopG family transcriptional regulator n=2 Tax=Alicyclobacillus fastidiosus TaxID=392011 RepID=A0ABY6ZPR3_9BACL|nr:hypothetical protein [Alicyclobacillus fastidiosus]WAH44837.1 hypothetical protein NZD89_28700 [Alicyclobacillus fastidiosus]GMA65803.1 hypothetical protein GCM10025859_62430 [Alicyclobacillus fastidiosus]GMA65875.1 hypothetical protein GCM10025859_63160 [Alicyclobacillus fastidiosus]